MKGWNLKVKGMRKVYLKFGFGFRFAFITEMSELTSGEEINGKRCEVKV